MRIKHAANDPQSMAQDGDSILKSLQNQNLPIIDLIVREAIQNSLDATITGEKETVFDLSLDSFRTSDLSSHLEEISDQLDKKYPGNWKYLAFSDKNTFGLTGEYASSDPEVLKKSNYQKLVFDIGKNQEKEGAGGSWGLGKTSYFRSGVGLVIYYTRIKTHDGFEERLIGSLIESPKDEQRLLRNNARGIAWWGRYENDKDIILPITDGNEIAKLLDVFSLERYKDKETGTMIVIPYFNAKPEVNVTDEKKMYWENDDVIALRYAVQRWYMPRLMNQKYNDITGNSWLSCKVNGEPIIPFFNTEETFNVFRELYDAALTGKASANSPLAIKIEPIKFARKITDKPNEIAGRVAFCEVSRENLNMTPPNNKSSGLSYIGVKDPIILDSFKAKVLAFTRKPGMVVRYGVDDDWLPKSSIQQDDHLLFAFYVPISTTKLHKNLRELNFATMETYLRSIENADHAYWEDQQGINIVNRTKAEITRAIQNTFQKEEKSKDGNLTASLARKYGQLFVPLRQGRSSTVRKGITPKVRKENASSRRATIKVESVKNIDANTIYVSASAFLPKNSRSEISVKIDSQDRIIDLNQWEKMMGNKKSYPIVVNKVEIGKQMKIAVEFTENTITLESPLSESKNIVIAMELRYISENFAPILSIKSESLSIEVGD